MTDELLAEQVRYYRERAPEYDETSVPHDHPFGATIARVVAELTSLGPVERAIELGQGRGSGPVPSRRSPRLWSRSTPRRRPSRSCAPRSARPASPRSRPMSSRGAPTRARISSCSGRSCRTSPRSIRRLLGSRRRDARARRPGLRHRRGAAYPLDRRMDRARRGGRAHPPGRPASSASSRCSGTRMPWPGASRRPAGRRASSARTRSTGASRPVGDAARGADHGLRGSLARPGTHAWTGEWRSRQRTCFGSTRSWVRVPPPRPAIAAPAPEGQRDERAGFRGKSFRRSFARARGAGAATTASAGSRVPGQTGTFEASGTRTRDGSSRRGRLTAGHRPRWPGPSPARRARRRRRATGAGSVRRPGRSVPTGSAVRVGTMMRKPWASARGGSA